MAFIILSIGSLAALICWVIVLIKLFGDAQEGGVGKGILGIICGIYAFIWGWQNKDRHNLGTIMLVWSGAIVLNIIGNGMVSM